MILVVRLPEAVGDFFCESVELFVGYDDEDLVGRGLEEQAVAVCVQGFSDGIGRCDGSFANLFVQVVREQRIKLQAEQPALGEQGAVLLHDREEMRCTVLLREDDGLAEECAAFRAADVEGIAARGNQRQAHIVLGAGERVGEAGAIEEERELVGLADCVQAAQFLGCVERAVLRRMRDVDHAGHDHVVAVAVGLEGRQICIDIFGAQLAIRMWQGQDLVPTELDGTGLMQADMTRVCRDDALIRGEQRVDDRRIRLRAADEKIDIGLRALAGRPDLRTRRLADGIRAIAKHRHAIHFRKTLQYLRMSSFHVIRCKGQ